ncbi:hypothetical protein F4779DRAFT_614429 [Xylariaceae sp. FL0662B]|nr:hypothetical protein F4779DRAFT_614429 [Xylariaceae sp. FL0662B]
MADISVTALSLALVATAQIATTYTTAYIAAPREITAFLEAIEFSDEEIESYDRDVARLTRLADKVRLSRLLREIQKDSDDLHKDLNHLMVADGATTLRISARILWANHRKQLEERVRKLDLLRMRFLLVYMGVVTAIAGEREKHAERATPKDPEKTGVMHPPQTPRPPRPPPMPKSLTGSPKSGSSTSPLRRLSTQAMGHSEKTEQPHRRGWLGVVEELQRSPIMRRRHASIEMAMRSPPPTPVSSPVSLSPENRPLPRPLEPMELGSPPVNDTK